MKSQNKGTAFHKWSRIIHRDLSFFFAGMILIYAISGIVMNHRDSINPHYTVTRTEYKITEDLSGTAGRGIRHAPQEGLPDGRGFFPHRLYADEYHVLLLYDGTEYWFCNFRHYLSIG